MAGGGEKPRLGDIGILGRALGARQFRIQPCQFFGAQPHAPFQRCIGALQRFGRLEARRHVGERDDHAAVGHAVGADFDNDMPIWQALQIGLALGSPGDQPGLREDLAVAERRRIAGAEKFEDFLQRNADLHDMRRQPENLAELPVRADQQQIAAEDRKTLSHVIERGLQDLAVEMQRGVGFVEQLQRGFRGQRALAQEQREDQPRRRRADRRRDQMLGVLQQFELRGRCRFEGDAVGIGERFEGFARAFGAEILRHRAEDVLHRDGAAPSAERRRDRRELVGHEDIRLQALDRRRLAHQRQADVCQDIGRQAPEHAVHQR